MLWGRLIRISTIPIDKVCFLRYEDVRLSRPAPPATARTLKYKEMEHIMIYADNAATTKACPAAQQAMLDGMERFWGNPSSLHSPGQQAREARQTRQNWGAQGQKAPHHHRH